MLKRAEESEKEMHRREILETNEKMLEEKRLYYLEELEKKEEKMLKAKEDHERK